MNYRSACIECGTVGGQGECLCELCHFCQNPMSAKDKKAKFGGTDVEHLAVAIYNAFHGYDEPKPWHLYGDRHDSVVQRFRVAAKLVSETWDKSYGSCYYDE